MTDETGMMRWALETERRKGLPEQMLQTIGAPKRLSCLHLAHLEEEALPIARGEVVLGTKKGLVDLEIATVRGGQASVRAVWIEQTMPTSEALAMLSNCVLLKY